MFSHESSHRAGGAEIRTSRKVGILAAILVVAGIIAATSHNRGSKTVGLHEQHMFDGKEYICSPGMYVEQNVGCLYCPVGTKCPGPNENFQPTPCPLGEYQPKEGKTSCIKAQPGHFVSIPRATAVETCQAGTYQPLVAQSSCDDARMGHFVAGSAAYRDDPCPPNEFQAGTGKSTCDACPTGTHQPFTGQSQCMQVLSTPWASVVPFTSLATLRSALVAHGCPDGLFTMIGGNPEVWSMIDVNPCEIAATKIKLYAYGGKDQTIATNTLTINATAITCAGSGLPWGQTTPQPWDCASWADFGKIKLIYSTGLAGRTFKNMVGKRAIISEGIGKGYAPAISVTLSDQRVVLMDSFQETATLTTGTGYSLTRYWHDASGDQMSLQIDGNDRCTYCDFQAATSTSPNCQSNKNKGDTITVNVFTPGTTFKCGTDVSVRVPFVQLEYTNGIVVPTTYVELDSALAKYGCQGASVVMAWVTFESHIRTTQASSCDKTVANGLTTLTFRSTNHFSTYTEAWYFLVKSDNSFAGGFELPNGGLSPIHSGTLPQPSSNHNKLGIFFRKDTYPVPKYQPAPDPTTMWNLLRMGVCPKVQFIGKAADGQTDVVVNSPDANCEATSGFPSMSWIAVNFPVPGTNNQQFYQYKVTVTTAGVSLGGLRLLDKGVQGSRGLVIGIGPLGTSVTNAMTTTTLSDGTVEKRNLPELPPIFAANRDSSYKFFY